VLQLPPISLTINNTWGRFQITKLHFTYTFLASCCIIPRTAQYSSRFSVFESPPSIFFP
jgi:hypothetical protein